MNINKESFGKALDGLRKLEKKKFVQSVDLIVNLKNYDLRTKPINLFVEIPHIFKKNKVCAFLEGNSPDVDRVITKNEVGKFDKKQIKNLSKDYDFFISSIKLMPAIATTFGKILGPMGKMPNPKFNGVLAKEEPQIIKDVVNKLKNMINLRPKELSIKAAIGKESMTNDEIEQNIMSVYKSILGIMTVENIRSVMLKFTMSKPVKVI